MCENGVAFWAKNLILAAGEAGFLNKTGFEKTLLK